MNPKHAVRLGIAAGWHRSGAWRLWSGVRLRGKAVVLMYHRVLPSADAAQTWSHPGIVVTRDTFEAQMEMLRRHFTVLTLAQFTAHVEQGRPFERGACLVTFDDGWLDTRTVAWPILQKYGIPATVFLPSGFVGTSNMFWQERLGRLVYAAAQLAPRDMSQRAECFALLDRAGLSEVVGKPRETVAELVRARKHATEAEAPALIDALERMLGSDAREQTGVDRFMSWEHVREMAAGGISFGAHSVTHRLMTTLTPADLRIEVEASKRTIEANLRKPVTTFCYPSGDANRAVVQAVADAGYAAGFSTIPGHATVASDRFVVPRINVHEDMTADPSMFLARAMGVL